MGSTNLCVHSICSSVLFVYLLQYSILYLGEFHISASLAALLSRIDKALYASKNQAAEA
jgi:hypothetical protein